MKVKKSNSFLAPFIVLVVIVCVLELLVRLLKISPTVLPTPSSIAVALFVNFRQDILPHLLWTLRIIGLGLVIGIPVGLLLAAIFSQFDILIAATTPLILILVTTPLITIVPLFMLWVGFNPGLRFIIIVIQVVPIVLLNTLSGFLKVPKKYIELSKGYGATKFQTFMKVIFPNALPQVFTGIKLGCIFSTIATISTEFVGGNIGLGYRVVYFSSMLETELVYAVIICIGLVGFILYQLASMLERRIVTWVI
ncbi:MAG: ABC transporter permease subunit [Actinomycetota bacterium]